MPSDNFIAGQGKHAMRERALRSAGTGLVELVAALGVLALSVLCALSFCTQQLRMFNEYTLRFQRNERRHRWQLEELNLNRCAVLEAQSALILECAKKAKDFSVKNRVVFYLERK